MKSIVHAPLVALVAVGIVMASAVMPVGLAEPWIAFLTDTGLLGDTGDADTASSDDTAASGGDSGSPGAGDTGAPPEPGDGGDADADDGDADADGGDADADGTSDDPVDDTASGSSGADTGAGDTGVQSDTGVDGDSGDIPVSTAEDTGPLGRSAAELAGERGGCGCGTPALQVSSVLWWLAAVGLAARRRSGESTTDSQ